MDQTQMAILILLGSFLLMIVLRFHIAFAVGLSSALCMMYLNMPMVTICQQMVKSVNSFSLMAVPYFITMGAIMGAGGIGEKIVDLANALVGWMDGGLAMVNCLDSFFFGGISGSAAADTASLGSMLIPMMVEQGYDADFATAITITSSVEGILVPPSHNMVIYSTAAGGVSVGALFMAGYVPGALLCVSLMIGCAILCRVRNYPKGGKFNLKNAITQIGRSFWAMASILIVVVGVAVGLFTATESAAIAVVYSAIVSLFIYKGLDLKGLWNVLTEAIDTLSIVLIIMATSGAFGYLLSYLNVPAMVAGAIRGLTNNPIIIALLINLILLVLGCIMDMAPIILITTPILLPLAKEIGMSEVQFGVMLMLNCGIGLMTPPVGSVLFIGSAVAKRPMEKVVVATLPFYLCMIIVLMLITFVPGVTELLPTLAGYSVG